MGGGADSWSSTLRQEGAMERRSRGIFLAVGTGQSTGSTRVLGARCRCRVGAEMDTDARDGMRRLRPVITTRGVTQAGKRHPSQMSRRTIRGRTVLTVDCIPIFFGVSKHHVSLHQSSQYYVTRTGAASTRKTCTVTATTTT